VSLLRNRGPAQIGLGANNADRKKVLKVIERSRKRIVLTTGITKWRREAGGEYLGDSRRTRIYTRVCRDTIKSAACQTKNCHLCDKRMRSFRDPLILVGLPDCGLSPNKDNRSSFIQITGRHNFQLNGLTSGLYSHDIIFSKSGS